MYRGEYLAGYSGETVILRYEPRDITEVLVYRKEGNKEVFLARAFAQDLETETIALDEAKASSRKVREAGKTISNRSILNEIRAPRSGSLRDRDLFTSSEKKTRKERQKEEQAELLTQQKFSQTLAVDEVEQDEEVVLVSGEIPKVEVLDYEDLLDDYGF